MYLCSQQLVVVVVVVFLCALLCLIGVFCCVPSAVKVDRLSGSGLSTVHFLCVLNPDDGTNLGALCPDWFLESDSGLESALPTGTCVESSAKVLRWT